MIPSTGWLGPDAVLASELLPMALPQPVEGYYREPTLLDPVAEIRPFPFTARISGAHMVVAVAGLDANDAFTTKTTLRLLEVFGAVLVDILHLGTRFLEVPPTPVTAWTQQGSGSRPVSLIAEQGLRPASVWDEE